MEVPRMGSPLLHLDLNNFESPEAEGSRYVLTSPRSLESCARLGVKPVDLLFKTPAELRAENQDVPMQKLRVLYEDHEKERKKRLRLCREEREKILQERREALPSPKPLAALETVVEQASEGQSSDSKTTRGHEYAPVIKSKFVEFASLRSASSSSSSSSSSTPEELRARPSESKDSNSARPFPPSYSLGDLRRSTDTSRQLGRLMQDIYRKLCVIVPEKDYKIAALMLEKQEVEQFRLQQSQLKGQQREDAQRQEQARHLRAERKRRKELLRNIRRWQEDLEARRRCREKEEAQQTRQQKQALLQHEKRWRRQVEEQKAHRRDKLQAMCRRAEERKQYQERLLKEKQQSEEAERERDLGDTEGREKNARRSRSRQMKSKQQRLRQENQREQLRHFLLMQEAQKRTHVQEKLRRIELEERLQRWGQKNTQLLEERLRERQERAAREEFQIRQAQLKANQEREEHLREKEALAQLGWRKVEEAACYVQEQRRSRACRVRIENCEREMNHRRLREHVLKEERVQFEQKREAMALKDRRRERIQQERQKVLERSRKVAHASSYLRDRVREQNHSRMFQHMALQAELSARLSCLKL